MRATTTTSRTMLRLLLTTVAFWTASATIAQSGDRPVVAPSPASDTAKEEDADKDVVVTGSRIDRADFFTPTPVTTLRVADLKVANPVNIAANLQTIPQFLPAAPQTNAGGVTSSGSYGLNLRALGTNRTLVLLDGRRFSGDNDLNLIPSIMVKRVDVVTGGASAAWGSGAIAGVVNLSLDQKFAGLRLGAQGGITNYGDAGEQRIEGMAGTRFAGDRGHVVVAAEYVHADRADFNSRPNLAAYDAFANPNYVAGNGQSLYLLTGNLRYSNQALGGLITSGVLRGTTFDPGGAARPFQYGRVVGNLMEGGEGPTGYENFAFSAPYQRYAAYGRATFALTDDTNLTFDLRNARAWSNYKFFPQGNPGNITILSTNAFLAPDLKARLAAAGQTSFLLGRFNLDFAFTAMDYARSSTQGTVALDGKIGSRLRWDAYFTYGRYRNYLRTPGRIIAANFAQAVDSVISPVTNQPVCRVALTTPTTTCVPINLFGFGSPSQAATDYVTGTNVRDEHQELYVAAATVRGEPFALWAGPVSFAAGVEGRRQSTDIQVGALDLARVFQGTSYAPLKGTITVREAFGEVLVPLVKDLPLLRRLEVSAAGRISDYNTSGTTRSWKIGATDEIFEGVRLRVAKSRDIRAPSPNELYLSFSFNYSNVVDPVKKQTVNIQNIAGGNPNLKPEIGDTFTAGVSVAPTFVPRFTASAEFFDIKIGGLITSLGSQVTLNRCFAGETVFCGNITRNANGDVVSVFAGLSNLLQYRTRGWDFEMGYSIPLEPGTLRLRGFATHTQKLQYDMTSYLGYGYFGTGLPRWRATGTVAYEDEGGGVDLRVRYVGPQFYNPTLDISNDRFPAYAYLDLGLRKNITVGRQKFEAFLSANNLLHTGTPVGYGATFLYDTLGRYYRAGARISF